VVAGLATTAWLVAGLGASGCGGAQRPAPLPPWVRASAGRIGARGKASLTAPLPMPHVGSAHGRDPSADLVVAALQDEGIQFGTDGSMAALWGYLRLSQRQVAALDAQAGDVVFFQLHPERERGCDRPDHAGLIVEAERDGRLVFLERRGGETRKSYADPLRPMTRRDASGRIRNSFLRPRQVGDPAEAPLYAGEMFCATFRPYRDKSR
jgi:hypothetical protein